MIRVKKLNQAELVINADLIEFVEANPDVTITLATGNKIVVRDSMDDIINKVIDYKAAINRVLLQALKEIKESKGL